MRITSEEYDQIAAEECAREEIAHAFSLLRKLPAKQIAVPYVDWHKRPQRVRSLSLAEAIGELASEGACLEQLLAVLDGSDCPLVAAYRTALCGEWQHQQASDIAEARQ